MTTQAIIDKTIKAIKLLPRDKAETISDFAEFVFKRHEESQLTENIQGLISESEAFIFLNEEEELYTLEDLKEIY